MHRFLPAVLLLLGACAGSPTPEFRHATRQEVTWDGRQYEVYYTDRRVEVIRLGRAKQGEHQTIRAAMVALIPMVTGCRLNPGSLRGDSGEMRGSIRC